MFVAPQRLSSALSDADATNIDPSDQLDFFNLVNGQGRTNKKPAHPAFALSRILPDQRSSLTQAAAWTAVTVAGMGVGIFALGHVAD